MSYRPKDKNFVPDMDYIEGCLSDFNKRLTVVKALGPETPNAMSNVKFDFPDDLLVITTMYDNLEVKDKRLLARIQAARTDFKAAKVVFKDYENAQEEKRQETLRNQRNPAYASDIHWRR